MKEYTLVLTENDLNAILSSLGNAPYIQVFNIINKLQMQINEQHRNDINRTNKEGE